VSGSCELQIGQAMVGYLCLPKKVCFLAWPMYVPVRNLIRHDFCLSVILGLFHNSLESSLSMSTLPVHLHILGVCTAKFSKLFYSIKFFDLFSKKSNWSFV
jgi:hypothetical protein